MKKTDCGRFSRYLSSNYVAFYLIMVYFWTSVLFYALYEGWGVAECVLFVIVTVTTVGYGTTHPTSQGSRVYTMFLMISGVIAMFFARSLFRDARERQKLESSGNARHMKAIEQGLEQRLALLFACILALAFVGTAVIQGLEGWSFITSIYFIVETITTVGYGDLAVQHSSTMIFLSFYILLSTVLLAMTANNYFVITRHRELIAHKQDVLQRQLELHFLADMNEGRGVNKYEFVLAVLEHIGTLDHNKDIAPWLKKFDEVDVSQSGFVTKQQLAELVNRNEKEVKRELRVLAQKKGMHAQQLNRKESSEGTNFIPSLDGTLTVENCLSQCDDLELGSLPGGVDGSGGGGDVAACTNTFPAATLKAPLLSNQTSEVHSTSSSERSKSPRASSRGASIASADEAAGRVLARPLQLVNPAVAQDNVMQSTDSPLHRFTAAEL